ncbi:hypothetical protein [Streptomyces sp. NPDC058759]|uniref:hypothetical protein n=1 Tax=Streptomyces sp. NPDC058759 TaxID=3346628 RepID=UPI0036B14AB5
MVVPVRPEPFLLGPGGVGVDLDAGAQMRFQGGCEIADRFVEVADGVEDERGALGEAFVQFGRVDALPHGGSAGDCGSRVAVDGQGLALA